MLASLTLSQKGLLLLCVALFMQMTIVFMLAFLYRGTEQQLEAGFRTQQMIGHMNKVSNLWSKLGVEFPRALALAEIGESGFSRKVDEIHAELKLVESMVRSDAIAQAQFDALTIETNKGVSVLAHAKDAWGDRRLDEFWQDLEHLTRISDDMTARSNELLKRFREQQEEHKIAQERLSSTLTMVLIFGLSINIAAAMLVAYIFVSSIARRAMVIQHNTVRLAHGVPLYPPLPGNDEIARLDRTFRQMTEAITAAARKERAVIDNARDLICTLDSDGMFLSANPASSKLLGIEPAALVGRLCVDLVDARDRERVSAFLQNLVSGGKDSRLECEMVGHDGSTISVLLSANWSSQDRSLYCVIHDITLQRQLEKMKRQFVAMITHDLRSPLTSVLNTLEALCEQIYPAKSEKGTTRINEAGLNLERMLRLIDDLIEMGQFDVAEMSLEIRATDLRSLIFESVGSVRAFAEQQNIVLEADADDLQIDVDRSRLVQVLVNLLSNAIKFSPPGAVVTINARVKDEAVKFQVIDRGRGISAEDQDLIFEPYRQARENKGEKRVEGTGLGLAICKSIVEGHGGKIAVTSGADQGSVFWIEIPLRGA